MRLLPFQRLVLASAAFVVFASPVAAQYSFVGTRAGIGGSGFIDWSALGPNGTTVSNPFNTAVSNSALTATVSQAGPSDFGRLDQGTGWFGNFTAVDPLLWTNGENGPMTIMFDGAISAVGANYQADFFGGFSARISALDFLGNVLASFDFNGTSDANGDGSAVFAGIASTNGDIWGVRFTGLTATVDPNDFAINRLEVNTLTNVVPEPSSVVLSAIGLLGLGFVARKRAKA